MNSVAEKNRPTNLSGLVELTAPQSKEEILAAVITDILKRIKA